MLHQYEEDLLLHAIKAIGIKGPIFGIATDKIDKMITKLPIPTCIVLIHFGTETSCVIINEIYYLFIEILLLMFKVCSIFLIFFYF